MKNFMKKAGLSAEAFPEFPKKKIFFNMDPTFV